MPIHNIKSKRIAQKNDAGDTQPKTYTPRQNAHKHTEVRVNLLLTLWSIHYGKYFERYFLDLFFISIPLNLKSISCVYVCVHWIFSEYYITYEKWQHQPHGEEEENMSKHDEMPSKGKNAYNYADDRNSGGGDGVGDTSMFICVFNQYESGF